MANMDRIRHPTLGPLIVEEKIGMGTFAEVFRARFVESNLPVALKIFDEEVSNDPTESDAIRAEFHLMQKISHPLIADVYSMFEFGGRLCYLMELIEGQTLFEYVNRGGPLPEQLAKKCITQILVILEYLHSHSISHRDVKCENIVIDRFDNAHLIDFGFARQARSGKSLFHTACGSPAYIAPEVLNQQPYDSRVDIWSLGVVLYASVVGCLPFSDSNFTELIRKIRTEEPVYPETIGSDLRDLLEKVLQKNPKDRISLSEIKEHPWLTTDKMGHSFVVDSSAVDMAAAESRLDIDKSVAEMLHVQPDQIRRIRSSPEISTKDALSYRIARKISIANSMAMMAELVLQPAASSSQRNKPLQSPVRATVSFLPLLKTRGFENPITKRRRTFPTELPLTFRTAPQLTTKTRCLNMAKIRNSVQVTKQTNPTVPTSC